MKLTSAFSSDSLFVTDVAKTRIIFNRREDPTTVLVYGEHLAEISFDDTIVELDSLEYLRFDGAPLTPMRSVWGVTRFNALNNIPLLDVYYNTFYPDSIHLKTEDRGFWIWMNLWDEKYPMRGLIDSTEHAYLYMLFGANTIPTTVAIFNRHTKETLVFCSTKGKGKINWIYRVKATGREQANSLTVFEYKNNGRAKKPNSKISRRQFYYALSIDRTIKKFGKHKY